MTTITRDLTTLSKRDVYRILSSLVIPRPIAWISTVDGTGRVNLAPFSSFMGIFGPPMLAVTLGRRRDGSLKDTHRNLRERGEAVVHIADLPLLEALHASGAEVGPEVSEVELGPVSTLVLLDVLTTHASERIWDAESDSADAGLWTPVSRLASIAGPNYGALGQTFTLGVSELP